MSQQQNDTSNDAIYIAVFVAIVCGLLFYFLGDFFLSVHLALRSFWVNAIMTVFGESPKLVLSSQRLLAYDNKEWDLNHLSQLSSVVRPYIAPIFAGIFGWFAYRTYQRNPSSKLRRKLDRKSLMATQVKDWPWIAPVMGLDLIKTPISKGPWAMAASPLELAKKYRLMDGKTVNRNRSERFFALQLGRLWEGPSSLPIYARALYACFALQATGAVKEAEQALKDMSRGMAQGKVDYSFLPGFLARIEKDPLVAGLAKKHAYASTVLCATLALGREYGVLTPSNFLWLRPVNRPLWYTLSSLGRRTPFAEAAGIHAHYLAECVAGHAIERPYVIEAVDALEKAVLEVKFDV